MKRRQKAKKDTLCNPMKYRFHKEKLWPMTLEKVIKERNIKQYNLMFGFLPDDLLHKIKTAPYIDVLDFWYDDSGYPEQNNWIDIEGIDYGWIWLNQKNGTFECKRQLIRDYVLRRTSEEIKPNQRIIYWKSSNIINIGYMNPEETCFTQIEISKSELNPI